MQINTYRGQVIFSTSHCFIHKLQGHDSNKCT